MVTSDIDKVVNWNETHKYKKAVIDSRLCPQYITHNAYLLIFITDQNSIGIDAVVLAEAYQEILCAL